MDVKRERSRARTGLGVAVATLVIAGCAATGFLSDADVLAWAGRTEEVMNAALRRFQAQKRTWEDLRFRHAAGDANVRAGDVEAAAAAMERSRREIAGLGARLEEALRSYLARNPGALEVRDVLAGFLADQWLLAEAEREWLELLRRAPDYADAYNSLGVIYTHMGRDMEAVDLFRRALELDPSVAEYHANLGVIYMTHREDVAAHLQWELPRVYAEGLAAYARAVELAPAEPHYARQYAGAFAMARHFGVAGAPDEAVAAWERYLSLDLSPAERVHGLNALAFVLIREKADVERAQGLLLESLELMDTPMARDLLKEGEAQHEKP